MRQWKLELRLCGPDGENYDYSMPLDEFVVQDEFVHLIPIDVEFDPRATFDGVVERIRKRQIRVEKFDDACRRLGRLLAHRMEDKEGWHGIRRQIQLDKWGEK